MATCPTCNCKTLPCGCEDQGLHTGSPCAINTPYCPNPEPCPETFSDCCIIHNGDTIYSGANNPTQLFPIAQGERLCDILQKMVIWLEDPAGVIGDCPAVIGIKSMAITSTSIQVVWSTSAGAVNYTVGYTTNPGVVAWTNSASLSSSTTSYTITGLTANTTYFIRVVPTCLAPVSNPYIIIQVTTKSV